MFSRPDDVVLASRSLLRSKETKALRAALVACFKLPDAAPLAAILPGGVEGPGGEGSQEREGGPGPEV